MMNSDKRVDAVLFLAIFGSLVTAAGCVGGRLGPLSPPENASVLLQVSVRPQDDQTVVEVRARNVSDKAVYVCETPATSVEKEENRCGPYVFYGGNHTTVLYWATTAHSTGVCTGPTFVVGAFVRRLEPGARVTLRTQLKREIDADWPWPETIYCDHDALRVTRDSPGRWDELSYGVDHIIVMVAYWEEAPLSWLKENPPPTPPYPAMVRESDGTYYIKTYGRVVPLAVLPPASYRTVVARRALRLEPLDPSRVAIHDIEMLAHVGPIALPEPLTIHYMGAGWPEDEKESGKVGTEKSQPRPGGHMSPGELGLPSLRTEK